MQIKIIKNIEPKGSESLIFTANVDSKSCDDAKQLAIRTDVTFGLNLEVKDGSINISETSSLASKFKSRFIDVEFESFLKLLDLKEDSIQSLRKIYTRENLIGSNKNRIKIAHLSISCSGRIKISFIAPEFNPPVNIGEPDPSNLKLGLGFNFKSNSFPNFFNIEDMTC